MHVYKGIGDNDKRSQWGVCRHEALRLEVKSILSALIYFRILFVLFFRVRIADYDSCEDQQTCPELMSLPHIILFATSAMSVTVLSMIVGDFPPNSRATGVKFAAAACNTTLPTRVLPVKNILSHL